jgi:hypothetical protein
MYSRNLTGFIIATVLFIVSIVGAGSCALISMEQPLALIGLVFSVLCAYGFGNLTIEYAHLVECEDDTLFTRR